MEHLKWLFFIIVAAVVAALVLCCGVLCRDWPVSSRIETTAAATEPENTDGSESAVMPAEVGPADAAAENGNGL